MLFMIYSISFRTYFTILSDKIIFNANLNDFREISKILKRKNKLQKAVEVGSPKRFNWLLKATKVF